MKKRYVRRAIFVFTMKSDFYNLVFDWKRIYLKRTIAKYLRLILYEDLIISEATCASNYKRLRREVGNGGRSSRKRSQWTAWRGRKECAREDFTRWWPLTAHGCRINSGERAGNYFHRKSFLLLDKRLKSYLVKRRASIRRGQGRKSSCSFPLSYAPWLDYRRPIGRFEFIIAYNFSLIINILR